MERPAQGRAPKPWPSVRVSLTFRPRRRGGRRSPDTARQDPGGEVGDQTRRTANAPQRTLHPPAHRHPPTELYFQLSRDRARRAFSPRDSHLAAVFRLQRLHGRREACSSGSVPRKRKCRLRAVKVLVLLEGRSRQVSSRSLRLLRASPVKGGSAGTDERDEHHVCRHAAHRFYLRVHRAARRG